MELYHLLNRGVDKRDIFLNDKDYFRFVHDLFIFNNQNRLTSTTYHFRRAGLPSPNLPTSDVGRLGWSHLRKPRELLVRIHAFCLMPNHYHLLVSPIVESGVPLFMKKLNMGYAKYFNEKYDRSGALFQGKYKSVPIENDRHFLFIPFYIHFNPLDLKFPKWRNQVMRDKKRADEYLRSYRWSSHIDYLGIGNFPSITDRTFLSDFFDEQYGNYTKALETFLATFQTTERECDIMLE